MIVYKLALSFVTSVGLVMGILLCAIIFRKHKRLNTFCLGAALTLILVCGTGFAPSFLARQLEWQHLPPQELLFESSGTNRVVAEAIVVLGGCMMPKERPRATVELSEAGDRIAYAAMLYKKGVAPLIICSGGGPISPLATSEAEQMADWLETLGIAKEALLLETKSRTTRENAEFTSVILKERKFHRVLLVTSAMHMPRSLGAFEHFCPDTQFIPSPTDFTVTEKPGETWTEWLMRNAPSAKNMAQMDNLMHEYAGILYYRLRGAMKW